MSQRKFRRSLEKEKKKPPEKKPEHQPYLQAMVWYKEEHWDRLKELFADADLLPQTYGDWLSRAEEKMAEIKEAGDMVMKVFVDPESFPEWCEKKGLPMDAEARSQFAIEVAQAKSFTL